MQRIWTDVTCFFSMHSGVAKHKYLRHEAIITSFRLSSTKRDLPAQVGKQAQDSCSYKKWTFGSAQLASGKYVISLNELKVIHNASKIMCRAVHPR